MRNKHKVKLRKYFQTHKIPMSKTDRDTILVDLKDLSEIQREWLYSQFRKYDKLKRKVK